MMSSKLVEEELHKSSIIGNLGKAVRHFKGNIYIMILIAENSNTGKKEMVYKAIYGECKTYTRPLEEFLSEVPADMVAAQKYRFELVELVGASK